MGLRVASAMLGREGDERLSGSKRSKGRETPETADPPQNRKGRDRAGSVGRALKTVYDDMLREDVPQDFLDLLGKLD